MYSIASGTKINLSLEDTSSTIWPMMIYPCVTPPMLCNGLWLFYILFYFLTIKEKKNKTININDVNGKEGHSFIQ